MRRTPGVFALVGAPDTLDQRLWVALLDVGDRCLASHQSAARLRRLEAIVDIGAVVSSDRRQGHSFDSATIHRPTDLIEADRTVLDGFPVTTIERTMVDLAAVVRRGRLTLALHGAIVSRATTPNRVGEVMLRVSKRGKPGMRQLAAVLDDLSGKATTASELERRLDEVLARTGLRFDHEYPLPADPSMTGFVDRVHADSRLIIEADGRRWHGRLNDMAKDRARDRATAANGYQTVRFMWDDVVSDPDDVVRTVLAIVDHRRAA